MRYSATPDRHTQTSRARLAALGLAALVLASGCESFAVRSVEAEPSAYHRQTVHAYLWNVTKAEPLIVAEDCGTAGISWVRAETNYLYWLAGVLSLGGWVPMGLAWRCAGEPATR